MFTSESVGLNLLISPPHVLYNPRRIHHYACIVNFNETSQSCSFGATRQCEVTDDYKKQVLRIMLAASIKVLTQKSAFFCTRPIKQFEKRFLDLCLLKSSSLALVSRDYARRHHCGKQDMMSR